MWIAIAAATFRTAKKGAAASGGRGGRARARSGDGEGWGRDREREFLSCQRDETVAGAVRGSPSETHRFGSDWDCRFTKR